MSSRMLIIVDVQNDFCEGGALGVDGGGAVAARIAAHVREQGAQYDRILATQDWHRADTDNGGHFAVPPAEPDFSETWPVHCVADTEGAALRAEIAEIAEIAGGEESADSAEGADSAATALYGTRLEVVRKGYGIPAYSALEGDVVATGESVQALLAEGEWERVDVVGLAYDFCVRATALGAVAAGAPVRVLRDLTAAVHPAAIPALEEELGHAGVEIVGP